jgi:mxaJ protein
MCSRCRSVVLLASAVMAATCSSAGRTTDAPAAARELRVCADPNNLPFSNERLEGFENRLASLVAREMHAEVRYTWWAQRRGFIRNTLRAGLCDVVPGVPASFELALATRPYYRSTYVFVSRADSGRQVESFDDPALRRLRIGVQMIGDDYSNAPPAHALAQRHIVSNVVGYSVYGDYSQPNPPARIVDAVANGEVDLAVVWGPLAGYFAARQPVGLTMTPVSPQIDLPFLPFVFDIAMGVRRADTALKEELDGILERRRAEIDAILAEYHVPRVDVSTAAVDRPEDPAHKDLASAPAALDFPFSSPAAFSSRQRRLPGGDLR